MASSAYPIAVSRHEQWVYHKVCKDLRSVVPGAGSRQDMLRADGLNLIPFHQLEDSRGHMGWSSDSNQYVKLEPAMRRPVLVDVRRQDSAAIFNYGIAVRDCTKHEKLSQFFMSGSSAAAAAEREGVNSPFSYHLMSRLQALPICMHPQPLAFFTDEVCIDDVGAVDQFHPSLIYPESKLYAPNPGLLDS
ncbi:hypothetical protein MKW98_032354 [Papaver atlanticum]|uniref:Uncharacterized protein n=1 Tax=Papaver atlanticum TaxID=357466 RepID=A0AAD4SGZ2_9MAGN|nr:hypothetical protein MKW98_032354 [Papaver atlanticum]